MSAFRFCVPSFVIAMCALSGMALSVHGENLHVNVDSNTGLSSAVVVENRALAHTTQILPVNPNGFVLAERLDDQIVQVLSNTARVLNEVGSSLDDLVRINVYVTANAFVGRTEALLKDQLGPNSHPVATFVVTKLPHPRALIAVDAIATVADDRAPASVTRHISKTLPAENGVAHVSVLPKGRTLYISGMAESVPDLTEASVGTMKQLHTVLALNEISANEVVHLKAYMKPIAEFAVATKAMSDFYPNATAPAMSFIEWRNGIPIEIELIAHLPGDGAGMDPVSLRWQPEEKRSPVYCRFAVVNSTTRIYTKGFLGSEGEDAQTQIRSIYKQLEDTVTPLGSDYLHLVKATYLHEDDGTSAALNDLRPDYYDPERPPAASKANVAGTGSAALGMVVDMIAVPK